MRKSAKLFVLAIIAVLAASFAAGSASANTITASPAGGITARSVGRLTFAGRGGIEIAINCRVTLRGSINETINNVAGGAVGSLTEGAANECNVGNARPRFETTWSMTLAETARLEGTPKKAIINVNGARFQVEGILGQTCAYEGTVGTTLEGEGSPVVTRNLVVNANSERNIRNSGLCPTRGELRGEFEITTQTLNL